MISSSWESLTAASLWRQTVELLTTTSRTTKKEEPITKPTVETTRIFGEKSAPSEDDNFAFLGASCDCGWDFTFVVLLLSPIRREDTEQITITQALLTSSRYNSSSFRIHSRLQNSPYFCVFKYARPISLLILRKKRTVLQSRFIPTPGNSRCQMVTLKRLLPVTWC